MYSLELWGTKPRETVVFNKVRFGELKTSTKSCTINMISELMLKGITSVVVATIDFVLPIALEKLEPGPPMSPKETHPARSRVRYTWTMNDKTC